MIDQTTIALIAMNAVASRHGPPNTASAAPATGKPSCRRADDNTQGGNFLSSMRAHASDGGRCIDYGFSSSGNLIA